MLAQRPQRCASRAASRLKPFSANGSICKVPRNRTVHCAAAKPPAPAPAPADASHEDTASSLPARGQGNSPQWPPKALSGITAGAANFAAAAAVAAAVTLAGLLGPPGVGEAGTPSPLAALAPGAAQAVSTEQLLFLEAWRAVDRAYVDKGFNGQSWFRVREAFLKKESFESRPQTYDAIRKLLASLDDPFTRFLEPSRLVQLRGGTQKSSVTGVGLEVTFTADSGLAGSLLRVVAPAEGGPAERAGVRPGDVILAVDDKPTTGISLYEASDLLQGPVGTPVTLRVQSSGPDGKPLPARDVSLMREVVVIRPVSYATCSGVNSAAVGLKTGAGAGAGEASEAGGAGAGGRVEYIRVTTFNSNTFEGVYAAIKEAKAAGVDGLILDLRNNGGGLFPAGVQVAKLLMAGGDIVLISDSAGVRDIYSADGSGTMDTKTPLSVWVNKGTASASEVLAGALKDNGRGVVVGENTFGKGLIQTVVDLSDGSGLAITVAKYQTPAGVDINRVGITPDIRVSPDSLAIGGPAVCDQLAGPDAPRVFG
ncbi:hypothetical protein PLESTB_000616700 [Pleodorina starrii]|uniref:PDZ domain-containing protein n=1 Tax=Pleodorina starrii TaxID=330485 RepID=A0A9W6BJ19_9CHLO|nr:hypothetical protein PLESTM_001736300 [Pleodorina starrii]GLC52326.1 hypothetical protein PLESTB_000616700 [Pleodorina starrii]GLC68003.1 hypothetical protein PLESTF_000633500 [Pleodorina starrii]